MSCPSCGYLLQKLSVTTNAGGKFDVDHCGRCGGTWFDPYEINRIPFHEVTRIAHLTVLPRTSLPQNDTYLCPRCHKNMVLSHYESVPRGLHMLRCPKCHGIWATQKALEVFKKHQEETIAEYKNKGVAFPSLSVVFVPAIFILLLMVSTFVTVTKIQEEKDARIKADESITSISTFGLTGNSVNIAFSTKTKVRSYIYYGPSSLEFVKKAVNETYSVSHHIFLTNLTPNSFYVYKITLEDETGRKYTTRENSFVTTP